MIDLDDEGDDDPQPSAGESSKESEKLFAAFKLECGERQSSYKRTQLSFLKEFFERHRAGLTKEIADKFLFLVGHVQEGSRADWLRGGEMASFLKKLLNQPRESDGSASGSGSGSATRMPSRRNSSSSQSHPVQETRVAIQEHYFCSVPFCVPFLRLLTQ